jgi:hypothetical protein
MEDCKNLKPPSRLLIRPGNYSLMVGRELAKGADNAVYLVPGGLVGNKPTPMLLRSSVRSEESPDELRKERAFAKIAEQERIHPVIYALGIRGAPLGCRGYRSLVLMDMETSLHDLLYAEQKKTQTYAQFLSSPGLRQKAVESILGCLFRTADLGLCLLDVKPANIVCSLETGSCHLIDFDSAYVWWMPEEVLEVFDPTNYHSSPQIRRAGAACARSRAVFLYLMLLLLYAHLQKDFTAQAPGTFASQLSDALKRVLAGSCVPLHTLLDHGHAYVEGGEQEEDASTFFHALALVLEHYFKEEVKQPRSPEKLLEWFFLEYPLKKKLTSPFCSGKDLHVHIRGIPIEDDKRSVSGGPREAGIEGVTDAHGDLVPYPCAPLLAARKYLVDRNFPFIKLFKVTNSASYPFRQLAVYKKSLGYSFLEAQ